MRISDWSSDVCSSDLWAREDDVVDAINREHRNPAFLPGAALSPSLTATGELAGMADLDALLIVVPVPYLRAVLADLPRSEERRVGKGCGSKCRSRWSAYH